MDSPDKLNAAPPVLSQRAWRSLVAAGAAAGSISAVLTVFGFLVEHAYFDQLGVPRTLYEATPTEYIVTGGNFLLGIVPLAMTGAIAFVLVFWWLAFIGVAAAAAAIRLRCPPALQWLLSAVWLGVALSVVSLRFQGGAGVTRRQAVAMFTFLVAAGILFCCMRLMLDTETRPPSPFDSRLFTLRIPSYTVLIAAIVTLPYLRGAYAIQREYPIVEFLGKDRDAMCALINGSSSATCAETSWELIEAGKQRVLLRKAGDVRIYVIPVSALNTFRISRKGATP